MSSLATQDLITGSQTPSAPLYTAPDWAPATSTEQPQTGLSEEQCALDQAAAAEAGMGATEVGTLGSFGLRPSEMDPEAARRMGLGLRRMEALLACEDGNATACELTGPGLVGHESTEQVSGETSQDLVVEDAEFSLRISTRTTADGQTERVLTYQDVDGTFLSGVSAGPVEGGPETEPPAEQAPAPDEEGLGSFLEGALLGDFAGNDTWSAVAGQTVVGLIPVVGQVADARDTVAAVIDVAQGEEGAWARLGAAALGWLPGLGDALKGGARLGMRAGAEVVEEGAERVVKEVAEEGGERIAREGAETAEKRGLRTSTEEGVQSAAKADRITPSRSPDPGAVPRGSRTKLNPNDKDPDNIRALTRENESADVLAKNGYDIEQNPSVPGRKNPDYRIEGQIFDNIAPKADRPYNIWDRARKKVLAEQTRRIVLNLDDSAVDIEVLRAQFAAWPIEDLQEVLVVRGGKVTPLYP